MGAAPMRKPSCIAPLWLGAVTASSQAPSVTPAAPPMRAACCRSPRCRPAACKHPQGLGGWLCIVLQQDIKVRHLQVR